MWAQKDGGGTTLKSERSLANPVRLIDLKLKSDNFSGNASEIIRLSSIINRLNNSAFIEHTLIHTGQNYDKNLNDIFSKHFQINLLCNYIIF